MSWPRLILKGGIEALLAYNFSHYNGSKHRPDWDCFATDKKQPNGLGNGENVSAEFETIVNLGFILCLVGCGISGLEMINKKVNKKPLLVLTGILDTLLAVAALAWLIYCSMIRLSRNGKICAGATTNVSEATYPYAYDQGAFLQVMLVLMYVIPPTLLVATNCGCL